MYMQCFLNSFHLLNIDMMAPGLWSCFELLFGGDTTVGGCNYIPEHFSAKTPHHEIWNHWNVCQAPLAGSYIKFSIGLVPLMTPENYQQPSETLSSLSRVFSVIMELHKFNLKGNRTFRTHQHGIQGE